MKTIRPNRLLQNSSSSRRGVVVLFALIALLLTSVIGGSLLKTALAQRRFALREQTRLQSIWLAESGIERAAARLSRDPNYTGETWSVSASDIATPLSTDISVAPGDSGTGQVTGVPPGTDRTLTILGLDGVGDVIYKGGTTGINVFSGQVTDT